MPQTLNHRLPEFLCPDLRYADTFREYVGCVNTLLQRPQESIVDKRRDVALPDVNQHRYRTQQEPRGVRHILSRNHRGRPVNGLEHGHMLANIR